MPCASRSASSMVAHTLVTLDGPAGVGKTTIAKRLAAHLQIAYLDTGAMFRSVAWLLGEGAWELPEAELGKRLKGLAFRLDGSGAASHLLLNETPLPADIRTETVAAWASNLAALPLVREFLKTAQQAIGSARSLTAEGRDMGTVVFPQARYKFFLDATPAERAERRCLQLAAMGQPADYQIILEQIQQRDIKDRTRAVAPLVAAADAVVLDTSSMDVDQVFTRILTAIEPVK